MPLLWLFQRSVYLKANSKNELVIWKYVQFNFHIKISNSILKFVIPKYKCIFTTKYSKFSVFLKWRWTQITQKVISYCCRFCSTRHMHSYILRSWKKNSKLNLFLDLAIHFQSFKIILVQSIINSVLHVVSEQFN